MNCQIPRATPEEIDRYKRGLLVSIISRYTDLKRNKNEFVGLCPFHAEKTPSFTVVPEKGFFHCFGCGASGDVFAFLERKEGWSFAQAIDFLRGNSGLAPSSYAAPAAPPRDAKEEEKERRKRIQAARQIWSEAEYAGGTIVEAYLASRGIRGIVVPPAIRFHRHVWNADAKTHLPAMIAAVTAKNQIVGIHRTFLRSDGSGKADVPRAKMMLGCCKGGHAQLDNSRIKLAIAEGIETALTLKMAAPGLPIWAALSLNNLDAPVPESVKELILCVDADEKDRAAAERMIQHAARIHARAGRVVRIARPKPGKDFNDMVFTKGGNVN